MSDEDLDAKFRSQAGMVLPAEKIEKLRRLCLGARALDDVGQELGAVLH
jgi:hypothetical protein